MEQYSTTIITHASHENPEMLILARKMLDTCVRDFKPYASGTYSDIKSYVVRTHNYAAIVQYTPTEDGDLIVSIEASFLSDDSVIDLMSTLGDYLVRNGFDVEVGGRRKIQLFEAGAPGARQKISELLGEYFSEFDQQETDAVYPCLPNETSSIIQKLERRKSGLLGSVIRKPEAMNIVFDMDNTLIDEFGATVRPGIVELLKKLKSDGHSLYLWTNSTKQRAISILREHNLMQHFVHCIYREDYDPENSGVAKDILAVAGSWLIDDDPQEIAACRKSGAKGFLISPYRKGGKANAKELNKIYSEIKKSNSFFRRLFA